MFDSLGRAILKIYLKNDKLEKFKEIKNQYKTDYDYELQKIDNEVLQISLKDQLKQAFVASDEDLDYIQEEFTNFCKNQQLKKNCNEMPKNTLFVSFLL